MPAILHVELVEQTATALELRLWRDNPNDIRTRTLALPEIANLVGKAEADYYSPLPAKLREIGETLFRWLDGGERWLSEEIQATANQEPVLVLAIDMPHGLAHLPWEVLHDGTTFLVHALNPAVLPVRWRKADIKAQPPSNRLLQVLFMASSPTNVEPKLDFEGEEHNILEATASWPLDLVVEESGCLEDLGGLLHEYGAGFFDVLHLSGHAGHAKDGTPVFLLEDSEGQRANATALDLARELPHRPPFVFLSGCRTGQNSGHGEVRSLAEQLVANGFRAVLGWGRPVGDGDATLAATHVYRELAAGESVPRALVRAYAELHEAGAHDWHLLRLFCAGDPPAAFVTPPMTKGRQRPSFRPAASEFLDPLTKKVKVATRASFVGRRRLLQDSLRQLRQPEAPRVGLQLRGQGGRGKSSVAARLCDRLRGFQRVVVIGRLDEPALINAWEPGLPNDAVRQALRDPAGQLRYRIQDALTALADAGRPAPLFVLDDFEQNQPDAGDGDLQLTPHASAVLLSLFEAIEHTGYGRVLLTCRYALPAPFDGYLHEADVPPLDTTEQRKQALRLDQKTARHTEDADLLAQALNAADGNPRLFEWLHSVLEKPGLDHAGILAEMQEVEERFREDILARRLIASLTEEDRVLLGRMLLLSLPIPMAAVHTLDRTRGEADVRGALEHAADLSLVDATEEDGQPHFRVPHQLGGGNPPLLPVPEATERAALTENLFEVLNRMWHTEAESTSEDQVLELIRLAADAGRKDELVMLADMTTARWNYNHRYREVQSLLEAVIDPAARHHALLLNLARALGRLGHVDTAGELLREAADQCPASAEQERAGILFHLADWMIETGELDEALRIYESDLIPALDRLGDAGSRAVTLGKIADVLAVRGELDEALRIRREEQLPVFERLGDVRGRAVALGKVADILALRGEFDEALRMRREEELPVYERLGDVRSHTLTLGNIADLLAESGEFDEALRIRQEQLPVYERLGDVRSRTVTLGKIADLLTERGELDEALRIRRDETLPVYERLGDVRSRAVTLGKIADLLTERGEIDEGLRIRREEQLPVFERLGDVRSLMVTRVKLALLLLQRRREEDRYEAFEHLLWGYQAANQRGYKEAAQIAAILQQLGLPVPEGS